MLQSYKNQAAESPAAASAPPAAATAAKTKTVVTVEAKDVVSAASTAALPAFAPADQTAGRQRRQAWQTAHQA